MSIKYLTLFSVLLTVCFVKSANILGIFHMPSKSHHILGSALLKALAKKGHNVTMISPFPNEKPIENYTDIFLKETLDYKEEISFAQTGNATIIQQMIIGMNFMDKFIELFWNNKDVQKLIQSNQKFDVAISTLMIGDSLIALSHIFDIPTIWFNTVGSNPIINMVTGNPNALSYTPCMMGTQNYEMNFFGRVKNVLSYVIGYFLMVTYSRSIHQAKVEKYCPSCPPLTEMLRNNMSLVLLNSHYSIESPRPLVPNMIQIGGFHVNEAKPLPADIKQYLDNAQDGAILFSLGSNVKIGDLDPVVVKGVLKSLGRMPMKVFFKSETDVEDVPKNIMIRKWLPQNDILGHPNIKLFISHGGLLSTTEAVFHGVPVLGLPVFGDQNQNIADAIAAGYALKFDILNSFDEKEFEYTLNELISNDRYAKNIKKRSMLLKEQPVHPMEKAIFWVEHVIKHKGADHLVNAGVDQYLFQYLLLDVLAFCIVVLFVSVTVIYLIVKNLIKFIYCRVLSHKIKTQ